MSREIDGAPTLASLAGSAHEMRQRLVTLEPFTCEACGAQHASWWSRTCQDCDRERESGELELDEDRINVEISD